MKAIAIFFSFALLNLSAFSEKIDLIKSELNPFIIEGKWVKSAKGLSVLEEGRAKYMFPYNVSGSYQLDIDFSKKSGDDAITIMMPVGQGQCVLMLGGFQNTVHCLAMVKNKMGNDNETTLKGSLQNNTRYRINVSVLLVNEDANISVILNGRDLINWSGRQSDLRLNPVWGIPSKQSIGLGANNVKVNFSHVSLNTKSIDIFSDEAKVEEITQKSNTPLPSKKNIIKKQGMTRIELRDTNFLTQSDQVSIRDFKGQNVIHFQGKESPALIPGTEMENGIIECEIASNNFSGLAFHGRDAGHYDYIYFRPFNSGTKKHDNTVQYCAKSQSLGKRGSWEYLRKNFPGQYESGADIPTDDWFRVRIEIRDRKVRVMVNGQREAVLTINPLLGSASNGMIGIWGYDTYFKNLRFQPLP